MVMYFEVLIFKNKKFLEIHKPFSKTRWDHKDHKPVPKPR